MGALARFWIANSVYHAMGREFPWGTLTVNVAGSFLMGLAFAYLLHRADPESLLQPLMVVGLLGAFTTFSTFSIETVLLIESGETGRALLNMLISAGLCVATCAAGLLLGRHAFALEA